VEPLLSLLAGWSYIGLGLAAWARRPGNRTGPLMVLVGLVFLTGLLMAGSVLLAQRWRAGSRAWRRAVAPLLWTGALALALLAVFNADQFLTRPVGAVPMWAFRVAFVAIPFAFLAVLLRVRLARASVAELVVELEAARPRCAPGSRSWRRHGRGSWRPPTRSASGSSGTSTTAPSSG
jgi:hypothetical protein